MGKGGLVQHSSTKIRQIKEGVIECEIYLFLLRPKCQREETVSLVTLSSVLREHLSISRTR